MRWHGRWRTPARVYAVTEDLRSLRSGHQGRGARHIDLSRRLRMPPRGIRGGRMAMDESVDSGDLRLLMVAVQGDGHRGAGAITARAALQASFDTLATEQRQWRGTAGVARNRTAGLTSWSGLPVVISERSMYVASVLIALLLMGCLQQWCCLMAGSVDGAIMDTLLRAPLHPHRGGSRHNDGRQPVRHARHVPAPLFVLGAGMLPLAMAFFLIAATATRRGT